MCNLFEFDEADEVTLMHATSSQSCIENQAGSPSEKLIEFNKKNRYLIIDCLIADISHISLLLLYYDLLCGSKNFIFTTTIFAPSFCVNWVSEKRQLTVWENTTNWKLSLCLYILFWQHLCREFPVPQLHIDRFISHRKQKEINLCSVPHSPDSHQQQEVSIVCFFERQALI